MNNMNNMKNIFKHYAIYVYGLLAIAMLTAVTIFSLVWHMNIEEEKNRTILEWQTKTMINMQQTVINWAGRVGGIYAKLGPHAIPSKYVPSDLSVVKTENGGKLVFIPGTYFVKLLNEELMINFGIYNHLSGVVPLNSMNRPDEWEKHALERFINGSGSSPIFEYAPFGGKNAFRAMTPVYFRQKCLKCHNGTDAADGKLAGGISAAVNTETINASVLNDNAGMLTFHIIIFLSGLLLIFLGVVHYRFVRNEHELAYKRLVDTEEKFRLLLDYTCDWEELVSPDGKVNYISLACEAISGHRQNEFLKSPDLFLNLVHPDDIDRVSVHMRESLNAGFANNDLISTIDFKIIDKSGKQHWISRMSRAVFNGDGEWIGIRISNRDMTEKHRLYQQILKSQKMEGLMAMATSMAHNFNNRLTVVINNIKKAMRLIDPNNEVIAKHLKQAEDAAWKSAEVTENMLLFVGHSPMHKEVIDVGELLQELDSILRSYAPDNIITSIVADKEHYFVETDISRLKQVVIALFTNSVDAIGDFPAGRINVRVSGVVCLASSFEPPFDKEGLVEGMYCSIDIIDNGCGMDETVKERIYDPFFTTRFTGRGLGMAAVLGIVRASRGLIRIESAINEGTKVTVLLPMKTKEKDKEQRT